MFNKNFVVEAFYVPGTNDYGFFDEMFSIAQKCGLSNIKPVPNKQKSIVVKNNTVYICQTVKFSNLPFETEAILQLNANTGEFQLSKEIPDTTHYQVATEYLWVFLAAKLNIIPLREMWTLTAYFMQRKDTMLHYNNTEHDLYREDGTRASMAECVYALSFKHNTK